MDHRRTPPLNDLLARLSDGPRRDMSAEQGPDVRGGSSAGPPGMGPIPVKIHEPGGRLIDDLQPPAFTTFEQYFQKQPQAGMFDPRLGPGRNFACTVGAYTVPQGQSLWLYDYEFWVNVLSGIDPGDARRAEDGRFLDVIGFDIANGARRPGSLRFELDPTPIEIGQSRIVPASGRSGTLTSAVAARAQSFASTSGAGLSLLPLRPEVQGARGRPFTWVCRGGDDIVLSAVVFRPFRTPIASIGGRIAGYLINTQLSEALLARLRPQ